jgi:hypothetical protein
MFQQNTRLVGYGKARFGSGMTFLWRVIGNGRGGDVVFVAVGEAETFAAHSPLPLSSVHGVREVRG